MTITVNDYLKTLSLDNQKIISTLSKLFLSVIPDGIVTMGYGVPTIKLNGKNVIHFAAFKNHIGLYPVPVGSKSFNNKIQPYIKGKGTLQFQLSEEMPYELMKEIAKEHFKRVRQK